MNEKLLLDSLDSASSITCKTKAVRSRISKAKRAEAILGQDLDHVICDDSKMYAALLKIKSDSKEMNGVIQNALRWYYKAINGREFPTLREYEYCHHK